MIDGRQMVVLLDFCPNRTVGVADIVSLGLTGVGGNKHIPDQGNHHGNRGRAQKR
jgi:hypothetical protein